MANFADITSVPTAKYQVVLADPPWAFLTYSGNNATPHRSAEDHYSTMSFADLAALPVASLAAKNSALFMWVVGSHIEEAMKLGRAWGYRPITDAFYWFKERLINADQIDMFTRDVAPAGLGMGYWTRKQVEPCLLFTRGKPKRLSKSVRQAIIAPRREHSRKPDEQYERIEALCAGPYLELFARTSAPGWDCWGNDMERFALAGAG